MLRPVTTVPFGEKYIFQISDAVSAAPPRPRGGAKRRRSEEEEKKKEEERGGGEKKTMYFTALSKSN